MKNFQPLRQAIASSQLRAVSNPPRLTPADNSSLLHSPSRFTRYRRPFPARSSRALNFPRRHYAQHKPPGSPNSHTDSPTPSLSLSQRFRKLSREYGWSAFGVYMLLTALDLPFCFAAVRYLGTDRIGRYEHALVDLVKSAIPEQVKEAWRELRKTNETGGGSGRNSGPTLEQTKGRVTDEVENVHQDGAIANYDHGVLEAEESNKKNNASIWTELALAYAIHKTFIFVRIPLTIAVTPKVVKVLRGWGWDIGKRKPKPRN